MRAWWLRLLLRLVRKDVQRRLRVEALRAYLKALMAVRGALVAILVVIFLFQMMAVGLFTLISALVFWLPMEPALRLVVGLSVGCLFFVLPVILLLYFTSERFWYRVSGGERFFDDLTLSSNSRE